VSGAGGPLAGRRVLVTRPRAQAAELIQLLAAAGADVVVAPTIRIAPPEDPQPLREAAAMPSRFDWVVFSSANAVDAYLDAVDAAGATPASTTRIAVVGSKTAARAHARGLEVAVTPPEFTAEHLVDALGPTTLRGARVLVPRADIGRDVLPQRLRAAGALVTEVIAYRTLAEEHAGPLPTVDAVLFSSGSSVRNFVAMYGADPLGSAVVAVIGPVTAAAASDLGIRVDVQPATYTTAAMVEALERYFKAGR
jgi:uroporphyrinogen-III synthase